jgi:V/A-type H+-transporting ATPase subunit C
MPDDLGYINARVRSLTAKLLKPEFYAEAMNTGDLNGLISLLSQTRYLHDIEEAQSRFKNGLKVIDEAVARNFYNTARKILSFSSGAPGRLISVMLLRYDLHNLKVIARAKHAGRDPDEARPALFPAGRLKPALLENALQAADLPSAAQALAVSHHPLTDAFVSAVSRYASSGDFYELEISLDRAYYETLFKELSRELHPPVFTSLIKLNIDATNLRTALTVDPKREDIGELFIPRGKEITRSIFDALAEDRSASGLQALSGTSFAALAEEGNADSAADVIRDALRAKVKSFYQRNPIGVGGVRKYLSLHESEATKLRLLARGKTYGVPHEQLEEELASA